MNEVTVPNPRDVAARVTRFVEDFYGEEAGNHPHVAEGLWLAMQMLATPGGAANVMRYCGVNFADK